MPKKTARPAKKPKIEDSDLDPNAWAQFEKLVKAAAKLGPKPHGKKAPR